MKPATLNSRQILYFVILGFLSVGTVRADGMISHIAVGGGWTTTITLVNTTSFAQQITVWFWNNSGPLTLNVTGLGPSPGFMFSLPANGSGVAEMTGDPATTQVGYATVIGPTVAGNSVFRYSVQNYPDFEASIPIVPAVQKIVLSFDNALGYVTGIALANVNTDSSFVQMVIRDQSGTVIINTRPPNVGHQSFVLKDAFPQTTGTRGTIEFVAFSDGDGTPPIATISAVAIRANPTGPYTTLTPAYSGNFDGH